MQQHSTASHLFVNVLQYRWDSSSELVHCYKTVGTIKVVFDEEQESEVEVFPLSLSPFPVTCSPPLSPFLIILLPSPPLLSPSLYLSLPLSPFLPFPLCISLLTTVGNSQPSYSFFFSSDASIPCQAPCFSSCEDIAGHNIKIYWIFIFYWLAIHMICTGSHSLCSQSVRLARSR